MNEAIKNISMFNTKKVVLSYYEAEQNILEEHREALKVKLVHLQKQHTNPLMELVLINIQQNIFPFTNYPGLYSCV